MKPGGTSGIKEHNCSFNKSSSNFFFWENIDDASLLLSSHTALRSSHWYLMLFKGWF